MAFEPGGFADKLGNRHEARWVAKQLLRLIKEEIRSITVEAIGDDGQGVDLWIGRNDGSRQAQQCKARNGTNESWSISDLNLGEFSVTSKSNWIEIRNMSSRLHFGE